MALHVHLFSTARVTREGSHSGNLPILPTDAPRSQHRDYLIEESELERFRRERRGRGRPSVFAEWQRMKALEAAGLYDPATDTHGFPPVIQEKPPGEHL